MRKIYLLVFLCCTWAVGIRAQSVSDPGIQRAIDRYSEEYILQTGANAALFSGKVQPPMTGIMQSLYLRDRGFVERDSWGKETYPKAVNPSDTYAVGDLFYDGVKYASIKMRLDLYRDEFMVLTSESTLYNALLDPSRFGYADLRGYRVIYVPAGSPQFNLPQGYYLRLYQSDHDILRKETFDFSHSRMEFVNRALRFYVEVEGVYHPVKRNKGSVLRLFRNQRRELDRFIRENHIDMKRDTEEAIVRVVQEYERLTREGTL